MSISPQRDHRGCVLRATTNYSAMLLKPEARACVIASRRVRANGQRDRHNCEDSLRIPKSDCSVPRVLVQSDKRFETTAWSPSAKT